MKDLRDRPPNLAAELEAELLRFEDAWQSGVPPDLRQHRPPGAPVSYLTELALIDLERRMRGGLPAEVETYLSAFPELETDTDALVDLAAAEFSLLRQCRRALPIDEYVRRYPTIAPRLTETLRSALAAPTPAPTVQERGTQLAAKSDSNEVPAQFGRYRVLRQLGQGGMGRVFLAEDTQLGRRVAVKIPQQPTGNDVELAHRFGREARAAATLDHPNLCPVHDVGEMDGVGYLAMAYVDGQPLSNLLEPGVPMAPARAVTIARKVALGLQHAHERGVVHRDLKPGNVMIDARGEPIVVDFGLARRSDPTDIRVTQSGCALGTPAYMSPEQIKGDADASGPASDVYGLGVMLYEMLTGRLPFEGSAMVIAAKALTEMPVPPARLQPGIPRSLDAVCLRALAKRPAERFSSMQQMADALERCLTDPGRRKWRSAVIVVMLIVFLGTGAIFAPTLIRIATNRGELVIETDDPDVEVVIRRAREATIVDRTTRRRIDLKAGDYEIEVSDGREDLRLSAREFSLSRGGKKVVKAWIDATPPRQSTEFAASADRRAAEWVISLGGQVWVAGNNRAITSPAELPKGPFTMVAMSLAGNNPTDEGVACLKDCRNLTIVDLNGTQISDAGLAHLRTLTGLTKLGIDSTAVTDEGLIAVEGMTALTRVSLAKTGIGDKGLARLTTLRSLTSLQLEGTKVTDAGLVALQAFPKLQELWLTRTKVTNRGLSCVKAVPGLTNIELSGTAITDAGLDDLKACKNLKAVSLNDTVVTDVGISKLTSLVFLEVVRTKVSAKGAHEFSVSAPRCRIVHDGGSIGPAR